MKNLKHFNRLTFLIIFSLSLINPRLVNSQTQFEPLKVGVIGLTHTHVHQILGRQDRGDIKIVGIVEPNSELAKRYAKQHGYPMHLVFNTMEDMISSTKPEAVTAFGTM